jgi:integrase
VKGEEVEPKEHESKMAIYKRGKVYWYEFVFNGERCRGSAETGDQRTARQREAHERLKLAKGEAGIETKDIPTLRAFSAEFMATIRMELAAKPRTVVFYQEKLDRLLENTSMADARLDVIDEGLIDGYKRARRASVSRRGKPLSPASVNRELATLRRLLRMAQDRKLITAPRVRLLKGEAGREFVLSREDEPRYLEALPGDMRPFCTFLIETGFRVGEALSLEWPQINLREKPGFVTVRAIHAKSSKTRSVPLTTRARAVLEAVDGRKGLVFRNAAGGALYHTWLDQQHAAIREALKLPADFVLHSLRHTFGTRLGEAGADSFTIMKLMGHSTVTVSQKYVHPSTESMRLAIERMGVLSVLPTNSPTVAKRKRAEKRVTTK